MPRIAEAVRLSFAEAREHLIAANDMKTYFPVSDGRVFRNSMYGKLPPTITVTHNDYDRKVAGAFKVKLMSVALNSNVYLDLINRYKDYTVHKIIFRNADEQEIFLLQMGNLWKDLSLPPTEVNPYGASITYIHFALHGFMINSGEKRKLMLD